MPALAAARVLLGDDAIAHLLRVACGLDSVIVGEDDVLHQVREALNRARQMPALDRRLDRLFDVAIATGRKARSRRTESSGNLAQSAISWLLVGQTYQVGRSRWPAQCGEFHTGADRQRKHSSTAPPDVVSI